MIWDMSVDYEVCRHKTFKNICLFIPEKIGNDFESRWTQHEKWLSKIKIDLNRTVCHTRT